MENVALRQLVKEIRTMFATVIAKVARTFGLNGGSLPARLEKFSPQDTPQTTRDVSAGLKENHTFVRRILMQHQHS